MTEIQEFYKKAVLVNEIVDSKFSTKKIVLLISFKAVKTRDITWLITKGQLKENAVLAHKR